MKVKIFHILLLVFSIFGLIFFTACPSPQKYSEIPEIKFKHIYLFDTIDGLQNPVKGLKFQFGLIDGDGNFGLQIDDSIGLEIDSIYINNFLSILFEINFGDTIIADSLSGYNFRIPYIEPQGQNKVLLADVFIEMTFSYIDNKLAYDSILFDFFVVDRFLNKSNVERTPVIYLDTTGVFPPEINVE